MVQLYVQEEKKNMDFSEQEGISVTLLYSGTLGHFTRECGCFPI